MIGGERFGGHLVFCYHSNFNMFAYITKAPLIAKSKVYNLKRYYIKKMAKSYQAVVKFTEIYMRNHGGHFGGHLGLYHHSNVN